MSGDMKNYRQKRMSVSGHSMPSFAPMGQQQRPQIIAAPIFDEEGDEEEMSDDDEPTEAPKPFSSIPPLQPQSSSYAPSDAGSSTPKHVPPPLSIDTKYDLSVCPDAPSPHNMAPPDTPRSIQSYQSGSPEMTANLSQQDLLLQQSTLNLPPPADADGKRPGSGEEQEEEDPDERWIELQGVHDRGFRIYFNTLTKESTHIKPPAYRGPNNGAGLSGADGHANHAADVVNFQLEGDTNEEKLKSGVVQLQRFIDTSLMSLAQIVSPAPPEKMVKDKEPKESVKKSMNKKQSVVSANTQSSSGSRPLAEQSMTDAPSTTGSGEEVSRVASHSNLTSDVEDDEEAESDEPHPQQELQAIRALLDKLHKTVVLREELNNNKSTSHIDFLIGWDQLDWDFKNAKTRQRLEYYRASSLAKTQHEAIQYHAWNLPEYFSHVPLPQPPKEAKGEFTKTVEVVLPQNEGENLGLPLELQKPFKFDITAQDLVETHLQVCVDRFYNNPHVLNTTGSTFAHTDFVFKVLGNKEFFDVERICDPNTGETLNQIPTDPVTNAPDANAFVAEKNLFWSYNHVRKTIRDGLDLKLVLVKKPAAFQYTPQQLEQIQSIKDVYAEKISAGVAESVLSKDTFDHLQDIYTGTNYHLISQQQHIPMSVLNTPFNITICGLDNLNVQAFPRYSSDIQSVYVRVTLFHGYVELPFCYDSMLNPVGETVLFNEQMYGGPQALISLLPRETRIGFMLYGKTKEKEREDKKGKVQDTSSADIQLGCVVAQLINEHGVLNSGVVDHGFWGFPGGEAGKKVGGKRDRDPFYMYRCQSYDNNVKNSQHGVLRVVYPTFNLPVVAPLVSRYTEPNMKIVGQDLKKPLDKAASQQLLKLINIDPLSDLTPENKVLLWNARHYLIDIPEILPRVLECVDWTKPDYRNEAYRLLKLWAIPSYPIEIVCLLDARYQDYRVREYAVGVLKLLDDEDLRLYSLQLVQCLKYESYHDSPLARFLMERSIHSPYQIGHSVYWHLKAEVHDPTCTERFAVILEELLTYIGFHMTESLYKQTTTVNKLQKVADQVLKLKREFGFSDEETTVEYQKMLVELNETFFAQQNTVQVPLNPVQEVSTLVVEKCRYMSSKMVPLWIVLKNTDPLAPPVYLIFKSGDDLRQDLLTLQILRVMDRLWLQNGLDNKMKPYNVLATGINDSGEGVGMIEVVLNSTTTSDIQVKHGGGASGALRLDPIDLFLRQNNPSPQAFTNALTNFVQSCAGYCVATYCLGIGDRHNGNIMCQTSGHLFHIDFGHFLGNFKKKFGINRERAAFVFTPEMAYVIGGKDYKVHPRFKRFRTECVKAYQVLRQNNALLQNLFILTIAAGMPELSEQNDILYLRNKLALELDTQQASKQLLNELKNSLQSTTRRLDNLIHNYKHTK